MIGGSSQRRKKCVFKSCSCKKEISFEPAHDKTYNKTCVTSNNLDKIEWKAMIRNRYNYQKSKRTVTFPQSGQMVIQNKKMKATHTFKDEL